MTLYKNASDTSGTSTCSATCLANWPPVLATGMVVPDPSLTASDFSTTMTTDARSMVTYKGSPLYHFKGDQAAGDTKGNGVGGVWSVVVP
jgi:predicted lipoprotein with Yx(FWY)xxD motif